MHVARVVKVMIALVLQGYSQQLTDWRFAMPDVSTIFAALPGRIEKEAIKDESCTIQFNISGDPNGNWHLVLDKGNAAVHPGEAVNPTVTIAIEAQDFFSLLDGKLSGQAAFLMGKLRVQGDMDVAMRLNSILSLG